MNFTTKITIQKYNHPITYDSKIILLASIDLSGIIASANTASNSVQAITSKDSLLNIDAL